MKKITKILMMLALSQSINAASQDGLGLPEDPAIESSTTILKRKYPSHFRGSTKYCPENMQRQIAPLFKVVEHDDHLFGFSNASSAKVLTPYANNIKNFMLEKLPEFEGKQELIARVEDAIAKKRISPAFISDILLRIAASQSSNISDHEQNIYDHVRGFNILLRALIENDGWRRPSLTDAITEVSWDYPHARHLGDFSTERPTTHLDSTERAQLKNGLMTALSGDFLLPVLGANYFGLHYMLENIVNDRYLIGFPTLTQKRGAHTIHDDMSPLGFSFHDAGHFILGTRKKYLLSYAEKTANFFINNGMSKEHAIAFAIDRTVKQNQLISSVLSSLLNRIDDLAAGEQFSEIEYSKILHGFFLMIHEFPDSLEIALQKTDFRDVLKDALEHISQSLTFDKATLDMIDPFFTSPLDGSTPLSDEEIVSMIVYDFQRFESARVKNDPAAASQSPIPLKTIKDIKGFEVKKSTTAIDVTISFISGETSYYTFATAYNLHINSLNDAKFLQIINKESFESRIQPNHSFSLQELRNIACEEIQKTRSDLRNNLTLFITQALQILDTPNPQKLSLAEEYTYKLHEVFTEAEGQLKIDSEELLQKNEGQQMLRAEQESRIHEEKTRVYEEAMRTYKQEMRVYEEAMRVLEEEAQVLEAEMHDYEEKMRVYEEETQAFEKEMRIYSEKKSAYETVRQAYEEEMHTYEEEEHAYEQEELFLQKEQKRIIEAKQLEKQIKKSLEIEQLKQETVFVIDLTHNTTYRRNAFDYFSDDSIRNLACGGNLLIHLSAEEQQLSTKRSRLTNDRLNAMNNFMKHSHPALPCLKFPLCPLSPRLPIRATLVKPWLIKPEMPKYM